MFLYYAHFVKYTCSGITLKPQAEAWGHRRSERRGEERSSFGHTEICVSKSRASLVFGFPFKTTQKRGTLKKKNTPLAGQKPSYGSSEVFDQSHGF